MMMELRKALDRLRERVGPWKRGASPEWKALAADVEVVLDALSNEEAGEAALAGAWEKARHTIALMGERSVSVLAIRALINPYNTPTVNGTDEPPAVGNAGVPADAGRDEEKGDLDVMAQIFVDRKYTQRADARQREMGLAYVTAERQDLAREIASFARTAIKAALREAGGRVEHVERAKEE